MRTVAAGSIVLGFAAVLVAWDASKRFMQAQIGPPVPSLEIGGVATPSPTARRPVISARDVESPKQAAGRSDPATAEPAKPATRLSAGAQQSPSQPPRGLRDAPALAVRQFTPGSKAHAEAIVTAIDSEESRNTVAPLARLYFAFFDRTADWEGLNYYIDERNGGTPLESIAEEFAGSTEFGLRYGALDNAAFIDRMYRIVFDVPPDALQRAYWIGQLESGATRGQAMLAFSESGAFRTATSNEVFVTMAYAEALRREPDPAGFTRWVRFLDAGNPREAVITGLLGGGRARR